VRHSFLSIVGLYTACPRVGQSSIDGRKEVLTLIRVPAVLMVGAAGIALAFFFDPESGDNRRRKAARSFSDFWRRGRKQVDSTTKTLRKVAS